MSLGDSHIPEEKAEKAAEETLRLEIGNLPHLGEAEYEDGEFVFPLMISLPRVIFDAESDEPIEVRFLSDTEIGEIHVDASTGNVTSRTDIREIEARIEDKEKELERAVQKALIKSCAKEFSLLPYSGHRFNPTVELLAELILSESIEKSRLRSMGDRFRTYTKRLDILKDIDLVREEGDKLVAGNILTTIMADEFKQENEIPEDGNKPSQHLNLAMKYLFEEQADNLDIMDEVLGPHLDIAGIYYQRAIETQEMPKVSQEEIRRQFASPYSGKKSKKKYFQASRVLLQLEQVGILESTSERGERMWEGDRKVREEILQQREKLDPIAEIAPV